MLSEQDKKAMVREAFDEKRVTFYCAKHNYYGPVKKASPISKLALKPAQGCADCWKIFFIHELADCPPDKREEKLSEIEDVLHRMVEMVVNGTWDFEPYAHPEVEFGKE